MKIATYNINGVNGRLGRLTEWLAAAQPDVVCLQEIKTASATFPHEAIERAGYGALWIGEKAYNGVAILARGETPTEVRRGLPGDEKDKQSRYIEAAVNGVLVACLYLPNGNPQPGPKFDYKLAWFERLIAHAAAYAQRREPVVLAGDFNVVPTNEVADIYNPRSWLKDALLQPESRDAYQRLLAQGWTDAIAKKHPGQPMYTYWDYFRQGWQRNAGLRIDHLLLNAAAARRLKDAGVDREERGGEKPSDHAPAWITLRERARS
ncbi:exodeoxyribonuclease III [Hydrogenophaga sp.]|uniref:exodeoxyribonuclease III n=1 Tax=Hydrogenophaga sp. TaxID=1904254 RepID=UPI003F726CC2